MPAPDPPVRDLVEVIHRLTHRDERLLLWLHDHHALTSAQIATALYGSLRAAQLRLATLRQLGFITRFGRRTSDTTVSVWTLAINGARYTHAALGLTPPRPAAVQQRTATVAASPRLGHLLGVNGFFTTLAGHARAHPGCELELWLPEAHTAQRFPGVRPDAFGAWRHHGQQVMFFLEYETGSQRPARLLGRLEGYHALAGTKHLHPVVFWAPDPGHETALHRELAPHAGDLTLATGLHGTDPADATLLVVGRLTAGRIRLADLTTLQPR